MSCRVQHQVPVVRLQLLKQGRVHTVAPPCKALESYMIDKLEGTTRQYDDVQVIDLLRYLCVLPVFYFESCAVAFLRLLLARIVSCSAQSLVAHKQMQFIYSSIFQILALARDGCIYDAFC
jgi:hypothetical protein